MEDVLAALNADKQETAPGPQIFASQSKEKQELAAEIERKVAKAMPRVMAFRQEGMLAEQAYDGHQWDEMDKMVLESLRRPTIVFNEIKPTINAISGIERLNRSDIRFVSRPLDSQPQLDMMGDLASEAYSTVLDMCGGDAERSRAIKDMSITGMGFYEIATDYESEPDGKITLARLPWREMVWDTSAKKENLEDRRWIARRRDMSRDEFKRRWGKDLLDQVDAGTPQYEEMNVSKYELVVPYYSLANEKANPQVGEQGPIQNKIPVIQYQWMEAKPIYRYEDPENPQAGMSEMDEEDWKRMKSRMLMLGMQVPYAVRQLRNKYYQVFVARGVVLDDEPAELPGGFGIKAVTGEWDEQKKVWYGVVRPLLDPQRTMNKSMSTALTMFLTNAKGGVMFETGAFADPELAKNMWSRADAWIEMNEGGAEKIVQRQPVNHQGAVELFFSESKAAMNYVSGIPADMTAVATQDSTSPTITKRMQAAMSVLGWYFDNINRARREEARTCLEYIREYWTQGQLIKVGGPTNGVAIPLLKSNLPIAYDLMLDESVRHNPNLKAQVWQDLQPIIPALLKFGLGSFLLQILKFSPLPAQVVADIQKQAAGMQGQPTPPGKGGQGQKGPKEDPAVSKAKAEKMSADAQKAIAEARMLDQESQSKLAEMALDAMHKHEVIRQKDELNRHRMFTDAIKSVKLMMGTGRNYVG